MDIMFSEQFYNEKRYSTALVKKPAKEIQAIQKKNVPLIEIDKKLITFAPALREARSFIWRQKQEIKFKSCLLELRF